MTTNWTGKLASDGDRPAPAPSRTAPSGGTAYGRKALEHEADGLRGAPEGMRNDRLNAAAFAVGQLVAGGELEERDAREVVLDAAATCGLGRTESAKTFASGFEAGQREPRSAPPKPERMAGRKQNGATNGNGASRADDLPEPPPGRFDDDGVISLPDRNGEGSEPATEGQAQGARSEGLATFEVIEAAAIFAELEEPDYLVEGIIRRASVNELVAYGQSGKTWIAGISAPLAVAAGVPWLGRFACKQGRSLLLDYESGVYESRRRFKRNALGMGLEHVQGVSLVSMPPIYMPSPKFEAALLHTCAGFDLVVIDSLKAANPGVDENDSNMRTGLDVLRRVGEKTGCAFLVLVHAKKTSGALGAIDPREAGRGSSSIYDAADVVLHVAYREGKPLLVSQTKARLGRPVDPFTVSIVDTDNGGVKVTAEDAPKASEQTGGAAFTKLCDDVLEVVRAHPGASGRVVRAQISGARAQSVLAALEMLERHGAIRNAGTATKAQWFPTGKALTAEKPADDWSDFDA